MKKFIQSNFIFLFLIIVSLALYSSNVNDFTLHLFFKPLIVISLLVYFFIKNGQKESATNYLICGLLFSLIGDVLLIFEQQNAWFFIGGLITFLTAHLFYIIYYLRSAKSVSIIKLKNKSIFTLLLLVYGIIFYFLLYNNLGELRVPVFIYTAVLIAMNIFALNRFGKVNNKSFNFIMVGALFFALSDSLLAVNKFLSPIPLAKICILGSYAAAQYFITIGSLSKEEKKNDA